MTFRLQAATLVVLSVGVGACGGGSELLAGGDRGGGEVVGLRRAGAVGDGGLGYEVELTGGGELLVSVELTTAFDLIVREVGPGKVSERSRTRIGPAEWDVHDLAVAPAGAHAFVASADGTVRAYDLSSGALALTWHLGAGATAVAVSADGALVATGSSTGVVCLRRARDGALLQCVAAHQRPVSGLEFARRRLASASWDGSVVLWEVPSLAVIGRRRGPSSANAVALSPDGSRIAIARGRIPPRRTPDLARREQEVGAAKLDPSAFIEIWNPETGSHFGRGHSGPITAVAWIAGGSVLLSASWDRTARLWRADGLMQVAKLEEFPHLLRDVAVDPSGRFAALAAWSPGGRSAPIYLVRLIQGGPGAD